MVAHHRGFFAFKLCPQNNPTETVLASCFDKYPLKLENGERFYHLAKNNIHGPGRVKAKVQLPIGLTCWHCILQTTYVSGKFFNKFHISMEHPVTPPKALFALLFDKPN